MAAVNDLVLVHIDNNPAFFARIEEITPDVKPDWWHVTLLALGIPLKLYTWILDTSQIAGEPFTMGGTPVRLERVLSPHESRSGRDAAEPSGSASPPRNTPSPSAPHDGKTGTVVSLDDIRRKR